MRYIGIINSGVLLIALLLVGTFVVLKTSRDDAQQRIDATHAETAGYNSTEQAAEQFRKDTATAKAILDNETTYSALVYRVANAVPKNVVLNSLELDSQTLGSKATMNAVARTYSDAVGLKNAFESKPELFSDVHFESLVSGAAGDDYPVQVSLSVIIKKDAL